MTGPTLALRQPRLTCASIHQQADRQRNVRVLRNLTDGLMLPRVIDREVLYPQAVNDVAGSCFHDGVYIDDRFAR